jgi:uncharacterized protein YuzE
MKITYDKQADALYVFLAIGTKVHRQQEVTPGFILDLDAASRVVGIEILGATKSYGQDILGLHWISMKWKSAIRRR